MPKFNNNKDEKKSTSISGIIAPPPLSKNKIEDLDRGGGGNYPS